VNRRGKAVIPHEYEYAAPFSDGRALFVRGGMAGYLNRRGREVIPPVFSWAGDFSEGLAAAELAESEGMVGFIDRKGRFVIEPRFTYAEAFRDGRALVMEGEDVAFVNRRGRIVWTAER
jgi:hypothetical protein